MMMNCNAMDYEDNNQPGQLLLGNKPAMVKSNPIKISEHEV